MTYIIFWLVIAILMFAICAYLIGRNVSFIRNDTEILFFIAIVCSFLWPVVLLVAGVGLPYYGIFVFGKKRAKLAEDKKKTWEVLKK